MLKTAPAVFAVCKEYMIAAETSSEALFYVRVGGEDYFDESNGIMRSTSPIHKVRVPMEALDAAGEYTVCVRPIVSRKPYFTETAELWSKVYSFRPVPETGCRAYHISDAHNRIDEPVRAAEAFGRLDLLILNGDVIDHSGDPGKFANIYEICSRLTGGEIPVVFSRGNHDMRGNFAEKFAEYTPERDGRTYYTFTLGSIWGIILDCGEDKDDSNEEYGYTVACRQFRRRQTKFLERVIMEKETEYAAEGIKTRLVIAHNPFTEQTEPPFNIEADTYRRWAELLCEVKPDLMICGHTHRAEIRYPGHERDTLGQPCPLVVASEPREDTYIGCGFELDDTIRVTATDSRGAVLWSEEIK